MRCSNTLTSGDCRVRCASPDDAEVLSALGSQTFIDTFAAGTPAEDLELFIRERFAPDRLQKLLGDPSCSFLLAEIRGCAMGYAGLRDTALPKMDDGSLDIGTRNPVQLYGLYIVRELHSSGYGSLLFAAALQHARERGADVLWLSVWEYNAKAIDFYRRKGLTEAGLIDYPVGNDPQKDYVYWIRL